MWRREKRLHPHVVGLLGRGERAQRGWVCMRVETRIGSLRAKETAEIVRR
jgi:hypothetical protein